MDKNLIQLLMDEAFWEIYKINFLEFYFAPHWNTWMRRKCVLTDYLIHLNATVINIIHECYVNVGHVNRKIKKWRNHFYHYFNKRKKFLWNGLVLYDEYKKFCTRFEIKYFLTDYWGNGVLPVKNSQNETIDIPPSLVKEIKDLELLLKNSRF